MNIVKPGAVAVFVASLSACALFLWHYPSYPIPLTLAFILYAAVLWHRPRLWLILVPAALPVLDLAFFSGWFIIDEFDALMALTLGILWLRQSVTRAQPLPDAQPLLDAQYNPAIRNKPLFKDWRVLLCLLMAASVLLSLGVSFSNGVDLSINSFAGYYSPWNGVRVAKGFLWAMLLLPFLRAALESGRLALIRLGFGFLIGLTFSMLILLYERFIFVGLFSFSGVYRATGSFSTMHTGGSAVDAWLALTLPMIAGVFFILPLRRAVIMGALLMGMGVPAILATGSRTPLLAVGLGILVFLSGLLVIGRLQAMLFIRQINRRGWLFLGAVSLLMVFALLTPVLFSAASIKRLQNSMHDLAIRQAHWHEALSLRTPNLFNKLLGEGLGTFPKRWFETRPQGRTMASYRYGRDAEGNRYLTLTSGVPLYMGQRVDVQPHYPYLLEMRVRTQDPDAELSFALCEIWLLASMRCQHASQRIAPGAGWQDFQQLLNSNTLTTPLGRLGKWAKRPVRLTFYAQNAPTGIDIDALALRGPGGNMLLRNGSFEQGHDNWFWQSDAHDHWHIDNLWVATLFEQGWLGVVMLACLWLAALYQLGHAYWLGDYLAGIVLASLIALSIASITQSMFDAPRITMAIMLLLLTALFWPKVKPAHVL